MTDQPQPSNEDQAMETDEVETVHTVSDDQVALIEEPSTDLVPVASSQQLSPLQRPANSFGELELACQKIVFTNMVPQAFRGKPDEAFAAGLMGAEIGLPLLASLRQIYVVNGKPSFSAEAMNAMIQRNGHSLKARLTLDSCWIKAKRADNGNEFEFEFTMADAKAAGLLEKDVWKQYPKSMLWARALSQVCRSLFPDVMLGMGYTPEELNDESWIPAPMETVDVVSAESMGDQLAVVQEKLAGLTHSSRDRIDAWMKKITNNDGEQIHPGGLGELDRVPMQMLERIEGLTVRAAEAEAEEPVVESSDAVHMSDAEDIPDAEIVELPQDDPQAVYDQGVDDDGDVYAAIVALGADGSTFTAAELSDHLGWSGRGTVMRVRVAMAAQVEYGNAAKAGEDAWTVQ